MSNQIATIAGARTQTEYVNKTSLLSLERDINEKLAAGWWKDGPLVIEVYGTGTPDAGTVYIQPMSTTAEAAETETKAAAAVASMEAVDEIVNKLTGFNTMAEMLTAPGGYVPSIHTNGGGAHVSLFALMANVYDAAQAYRGDTRRAYRS